MKVIFKWISCVFLLSCCIIAVRVTYDKFNLDKSYLRFIEEKTSLITYKQLIELYQTDELPDANTFGDLTASLDDGNYFVLSLKNTGKKTVKEGLYSLNGILINIRPMPPNMDAYDNYIVYRHLFSVQRLDQNKKSPHFHNNWIRLKVEEK